MQHYECYLWSPEIGEDFCDFYVEAESPAAALQAAREQAEPKGAAIYWSAEYYGPLPETFQLRITVQLAWSLDDDRAPRTRPEIHEGTVTWRRPTDLPPHGSPAWLTAMGIQ